MSESVCVDWIGLVDWCCGAVKTWCGCVVVVIADGDDGLDFVENTHILYMPEPFHLLSASVTRSREHMLVQSWIVDEDSRSSR